MAKKPTGDCATCSYWRRKASPIKGKLVPGGTGKCTRKGGLCDNPKPKNPPPGWQGNPEKKAGASPQAPETDYQGSSGPGNETELSLIYPNPDQPRKIFEPTALEELAQSIREQGLIEPLVVVVRPRDEKRFMLVAGERRWKACQLIGLTMAPVRIIEATDDQVAEMALVENLQRRDLTPLEEAKAFKRMIDRGYSKEDLAQKLGFKQVWRLDERLSLLNLAPRYQDALFYGVIGPSQAFEISRLKDPAEQELVFKKVKAGQLPSYNHIRRFVNTVLEAKKDRVLFILPKKEDLETVSRWDKALDAVTNLIIKAFSPADCQVLAKVMHGNAQVNILKIDLLIKHLDLIKKAMLENLSRQEVAALIPAGGEGHSDLSISLP